VDAEAGGPSTLTADQTPFRTDLSSARRSQPAGTLWSSIDVDVSVGGLPKRLNESSRRADEDRCRIIRTIRRIILRRAATSAGSKANDYALAVCGLAGSLKRQQVLARKDLRRSRDELNLQPSVRIISGEVTENRNGWRVRVHDLSLKRETDVRSAAPGRTQLGRRRNKLAACALEGTAALCRGILQCPSTRVCKHHNCC